MFREWLSAVHRVALAGPAALAEWRRAKPSEFAAAILQFAGLPLCDAREGRRRSGAVASALLRGHGERPALILFAADGRDRVWSRAELLHAGSRPGPVGNMLAALSPTDLPALAANHLLDAGTAPDDRLRWAGDAAEPWPLGAWLVGATIVLGVESDPASIRSAPRWRD